MTEKVVAGLPPLPQHVEETVRTVEDIHEEHRARSTVVDRTIDLFAGAFARPAALIVLTVVLLGWVLADTPQLIHAKPLDPPPFGWLELALTILTVYITLLILAAQRRVEILANHRERFTLQLALLNERKTAKVISLIEEMRRESPAMPDRVDSEARAMSDSVDARSVSKAIEGINPPK